MTQRDVITLYSYGKSFENSFQQSKLQARGIRIPESPTSFEIYCLHRSKQSYIIFH